MFSRVSGTRATRERVSTIVRTNLDRSKLKLIDRCSFEALCQHDYYISRYFGISLRICRVQNRVSFRYCLLPISYFIIPFSLRQDRSSEYVLELVNSQRGSNARVSRVVVFDEINTSFGALCQK